MYPKGPLNVNTCIYNIFFKTFYRTSVSHKVQCYQISKFQMLRHSNENFMGSSVVPLKSVANDPLRPLWSFNPLSWDGRKSSHLKSKRCQGLGENSPIKI